MAAKRARVVIVGGGFGGLACAKALAGVDVDVTLVDRTNHHLFQPLLYQVAIAGLSPAEIAVPIRSILSSAKNVRVLLGDVTGVDLAAKNVVLDGGAEELPFDYLVLAAGAKTGYFSHEEWERFAPGLKSLEDAIDIRRRVLVAFERAERAKDPVEKEALMTFVVVGAGPTGVELAGAISELSRTVIEDDFRSIDPGKSRVVLVEAGPRVLAAFDPKLSVSAKKQLEEVGAEVRENERVRSIDEEGVVFESGERLRTHTVLWAAGVRGTRLASDLGVAIDRQGRVLVENDTSIPGHPDVFAIGDMAAFTDPETKKVLPGVSPVALQQGRYVAKVIRRRTTKADREPFHYFDKGIMATIGRSRAIAQAGRFKMGGFIAWMAWLFVHLFFLIGFKNRFIVLLTWTWQYLAFKRGARLITQRGNDPRLLPSGPASQSPERHSGL